MGKNMLLRWGLNIAGILVTAYFIEGFEVTFAAAIIGSIILGLVNATLRPLLLILTLPINILTLGLFTLVINGLMLWTVSEVIKGFDISGFWIAFISALIMMIINSVVSMLLKD